MEKIITQFATTEAVEDVNLFTSIGIDWKLLLLQVIAFLILLAILRKWVYPPLVAMLDKREAAIKASLESANEAQRAAENAESEVAALLKDAKREAAEIVQREVQPQARHHHGQGQGQEDDQQRVVGQGLLHGSCRAAYHPRGRRCGDQASPTITERIERELATASLKNDTGSSSRCSASTYSSGR